MNYGELNKGLLTSKTKVVTRKYKERRQNRIFAQEIMDKIDENHLGFFIKCDVTSTLVLDDKVNKR